MYFAIVAFLVFSFLGCSSKKEPKDYLNRITLKLAKPVSIKLTKLGKNNSNFNILAEIKSQDPILSANINWIVTDSDNNKISTHQASFTGPKTELFFDSGTIELPDPELNYKIVFIFDGKTSKDDIKKIEIYNSLIQDELDTAIKDLQERARK